MNGFRPGHEPTIKPMTRNKPRILLGWLGGQEQEGWSTPLQVMNFIRAARDPRYEVFFGPQLNVYPIEAGRNQMMAAAAQIGAEWLISFDNDQFLYDNANILDVIADATPEQAVIGMRIGIRGEGNKLRLFPDTPELSRCGRFSQVERVGGGILLVHCSVWQRIQPPWFRWMHGNNPLLTPDAATMGEDVYFCKLCREHGFKIWVPRDMAAGHHKNRDLTADFMMQQMASK